MNPESRENSNLNEGSPEQESHRLIVKLVKEATREFVNNEVLDAIKSGEFSREQWQTFAKQRYLAALSFENLLESGIVEAKRTGDTQLEETLQSNLNDELGVDESGEKVSEKAHETWRRDFYEALGVSEQDLKKSKAFNGTKTYSQTLENLIKNGDSLEIAGALLILEGSIPAEFKKIQEGRDKTFPDAFVDKLDDSEEIKERKARARLYIDDHIAHDSSSHYPDLIRALEKYVFNPDAFTRIKQGVEKIKDAKKEFYSSLQEELEND